MRCTSRVYAPRALRVLGEYGFWAHGVCIALGLHISRDCPRQPWEGAGQVGGGGGWGRGSSTGARDHVCLVGVGDSGILSAILVIIRTRCGNISAATVPSCSSAVACFSLATSGNSYHQLQQLVLQLGRRATPNMELKSLSSTSRRNSTARYGSRTP